MPEYKEEHYRSPLEVLQFRHKDKADTFLHNILEYLKETSLCVIICCATSVLLYISAEVQVRKQIKADKSVCLSYDSHVTPVSCVDSSCVGKGHTTGFNIAKLTDSSIDLKFGPVSLLDEVRHSVPYQ